jgi:signal transduction histidine kinase
LKILRHVGLGRRLLAIILLVVVVDFLMNTVLFERTTDFLLREDDAERMAENLAIASRVIDHAPAADRSAMARELSTERFAVEWSRTKAGAPNAVELVTLRQRVLTYEPELAARDLDLRLMPLSRGGNIVGSVALQDGSFVGFRTSARVAWSLNLGRLLGLGLPSLLLVALAYVLFRATLSPLRTLVRVASEVGTADPRPIPEMGQAEVRQLIRAFNAMQQRIHQLLASNAQTMLAVGHDLRTPLARLQLRIEEASLDRDLRHELSRDIMEMRDLLQSLQAFAESGDDGSAPERIDIAATAQTQVDDARDRGAQVSYHGPRHLEIMARPVSIRRALSNLLENAIAYAGTARVEVLRRDRGVEITVDDNGPGIPEDRLSDALRPFTRLDNARARNTAGMGLGLPIVERVLRAEDGTLTLANKSGGGLRATMFLPNALC